jgi:hypothetical protein
MAALPQHQDPTLLEADRVLEREENAHASRPYLGMSGLGEDCERKLWYGFRWVQRVTFSAETHKKFIDGHRTEDLLMQRIRRVPGIEIHTVDPETGKQFEVTDFGGHLKGHLDGAAYRLLQAPKIWHVAEVKASEKMADLNKAVVVLGEKTALRQWNFTYYVQAVLYMNYTGMERHWLVCGTPGGREWTGVRTEADPAEAIRQKAKAHRVIFSQHPLERISDNPEFYKCRWCSFRGVCHDGTLPESNCRTCLHVTPTEAGEWHCARWGKVLTVEEQRAGCQAHLYIPSLVPGEQIDASPEGEWVEYRMRDGSTWRDGAQ